MPHKKILFIVVLLLLSVAWFLFDSKNGRDSIIEHGKTELVLYSTLDNSFLQALIKEYNSDPTEPRCLNCCCRKRRNRAKQQTCIC